MFGFLGENKIILPVLIIEMVLFWARDRRWLKDQRFLCDYNVILFFTFQSIFCSPLEAGECDDVRRAISVHSLTYRNSTRGKIRASMTIRSMEYNNCDLNSPLIQKEYREIRGDRKELSIWLNLKICQYMIIIICYFWIKKWILMVCQNWCQFNDDIKWLILL